MRFCVCVCDYVYNVFNMWPKTALLLPVWPRNAKRLDTPAINQTLGTHQEGGQVLPRVQVSAASGVNMLG